MWSFSEGKHQENYHYVRVPAITNEVCDSEYGNDGVIKDSMICAGYPGEGGKDTCSGKSKHGPLALEQSFEKFQNAIFFKISKIPFMG